MKAAIVVLADPKPGTEEAFGRVFNALSTAYDYKQKGDDVTILFNGPGTRWSGILTKADHPLNALYKALTDNPIPGTTGLPSLRNLTERGYSILTF